MKRYLVQRASALPPAGDFFAPAFWAGAAEGRVDLFRPEGSDHRPDVRFCALHDDASLYLRFEVQDRYVRSVQTAYQGSVCRDSCVECFIRPRADRGYFNFETNAGGTLLLFYIEDATRVPGGFRKFQMVDAAWGSQVVVHHSLPSVVDPELVGPVTWRVGYRMSVALLEAHVGPLGPLAGQVWRVNFYKCGDQTSHPHWASWSPIHALNFHLPECFGEMELA